MLSSPRRTVTLYCASSLRQACFPPVPVAVAAKCLSLWPGRSRPGLRGRGNGRLLRQGAKTKRPDAGRSNGNTRRVNSPAKWACETRGRGMPRPYRRVPHERRGARQKEWAGDRPGPRVGSIAQYPVAQVLKYSCTRRYASGVTNSSRASSRLARRRSRMAECIWLTRDSERSRVAPISFIVISS